MDFYTQETIHHTTNHTIHQFSRKGDHDTDHGEMYQPVKQKRFLAGLRDLYRYATWVDYILIVLGAFFSIAAGAGWPMTSLVFGAMTDTFLRAAQGLVDDTMSTTAATLNNLSGNVTGGLEPLTYREFEATVTKYSIDYSIIALGIFASTYIFSAAWGLLCARQMDRLRKHFFRCVLRQEIAWFDEHQSGQLTNRLSDDMDRVKEGIGDKMGIMLLCFAQFFAGYIIAFTKSWELTLVMLSLMPIIIFCGGFMSRLVATASKNEQTKYAIAGGIAEEIISCVRTVITFNGQRKEVQKYAKALEGGKKIGVRKQTYTGINMGVMFFVVFCSYALAFWYGARLIESDKIARGDVFVVFMCVMTGSFALGNAAPQLGVLAVAVGAASNLYKIIDQIPTIDSYSNKGKRPHKVKGRIEFRNVKFSYPSRKDVVIFNDLSFVAQPGEKIALVGSSGCGKSTIVNLLLRFYDTSRGEILLDGHEIKQLNVEWLRNAVGVVSQEPILFGCSIKDNIKYGNMNVTREEMIRACKQANAHQFITSLPDGYDTLVGERGTQMSGGQKQRIAIARALVRDPRVILLDEATSALDAESEGAVQQALDSAQIGRTTLVIAHRLSTIRNADKIIALHNGQIREVGGHDELMARQGLYYELVNAQTFTTAVDEQTMREGEGLVSESTSSSESERVRRTSKVSFARKQSRSHASLVTSQRSNKSGRSSIHSGGSVLRPNVERYESTVSGRPEVQRQKSTNILVRTKPHVNEKERLKAEIEEENVQRANFLQFLKMSKSEWMYLAIALFGAMLRGVVLPAFAFFYSEIFQVYSKTGDELTRGTAGAALIFVMIGVVQFVGSNLSIYFTALMGENLTMKLRLDAFDNILRQDGTYFDDPRHATGKLCTRLATDAPAIRAALDYRLSSVLSCAMSMIFGILIAFIFGWQMALFALALLPLLGLASFINIQLRHYSANRDARLMEEAGKIASEAIENIRTVQYLTRETTFYDMFCYNLVFPYKTNLKHAHIHAGGYGFAQSAMFLMYAAAFRFGAFLVSDGDMPPLNVFRVFFSITFSAMSIGFATSYFPEYAKARMCAALIMKILKARPKIDSYSANGLKPKLKGTVKFHDLQFAYPSRPNVGVLKGLSLTVSSGQTVALVGPSGCGKTTTFSLLERLYDPHDGQICVDDFDIRTLNIAYLRSQISIVSQEPILFDCSIKDNIAYGVTAATHEDVVAAAKQANIHDFVLTLPGGYDTRVGEKGTQLSGGQKQRIAIARALMLNPRILLLDEATSALDTESEKIVQEALDRARVGRTCLVIAHRLSTVQGADSIAVLKHGRVVEQGTHSELVARKGVYFNLTRKQREIH